MNGEVALWRAPAPVGKQGNYARVIESRGVAFNKDKGQPLGEVVYLNVRYLPENNMATVVSGEISVAALFNKRAVCTRQ